MSFAAAAGKILSTVGTAVANNAGSISSGLFGKKKAYKFNSKLQAQQFEYNKQLAEQQNKLNRENAEWTYNKELEQWNRENEYNSPAAQMQRYKEAGLNPNLIYSSTGSNTAASSPSMNYAQSDGYPMSGGSGVGDNMPSVVIPDIYHEYMNFKTQKMQQDSIAQNIELQKAQMDAFKAQAFLNNLKGFQLESGRPFWSKNAEFDNLSKGMSLDIKKQQFNNLVFQNEELNPIKKAILELQNKLQNQNYMYSEEANPLKILQMKLQNNIAKNHDIGLKLDNDFKKDRNSYSANSFLEDFIGKQETNRGKQIKNDLDEKIKGLIQTPTGQWSAGDAESFLLYLIRGITF